MYSNDDVAQYNEHRRARCGVYIMHIGEAILAIIIVRQIDGKYSLVLTCLIIEIKDWSFSFRARRLIIKLFFHSKHQTRVRD
jgi:hypothetical protein